MTTNRHKKLTGLQHAVAVTGIRSARLRKLGLMPTHPPTGTSHIMSAVPIDPTQDPSSTLEFAMDLAGGYWPDCNDWTIGECDTTSYGDQLPVGFCYLHQPDPLCSFTSEDDSDD